MTQRRKRKNRTYIADDLPAGGSLHYSWSRQFQPEGRADINVFSTSTGTLEHVEQLLAPATGDYPDVKTAPGYFCPRCVNTDSRKGKGTAAPGMFWRDGASIADQSVYGFDFDFKQPDGSMHPEAHTYVDIIRDALADSGVWWALYTTASHTEEWPRIRVVMATDKPASGDAQMLLVRASILDRFFRGIPVDQAVFTPAQVMYRAPQGSVVEYSDIKTPLRLTGILRHARQAEVVPPKAARRRDAELTVADDLAAIFTPFMEHLLTLPGARPDAGAVTMPATRAHGQAYSSGNHDTSLRFSPPGAGFSQFNVTFVHDTDKAATAKMTHTQRLQYACDAAGADFDVLEPLLSNYHHARNSAGGVDSDAVSTVDDLFNGVGKPPRNSGLLPVALEPLPVIPMPDEDQIERFAQTLYVEPEDDDEEGTLARAAMDQAKTKAETILMHKWFQDCFVFVAKGSQIMDITEPPNIVDPYVFADFRNTMAPFRFPVVNEKGKVTMHSYSDAWIASKSRQTVRKTIFAPGKARIMDTFGVPMVNTFYIAPFKMTEETDLLDEFIKIVDRTHPIPKEKEIFLDWLAFTFRYPQKKCLWAYTNISEARGSGRGLLANAVRNLLGGNNVTTTSVRNVAADQYHDYAYQSLVSLLEEGDGDETGKRIKVDGVWNDIITGEHKLLNLKGGKQVNSALYNNFMIFLNHYSLIIDKADRRIQAITGAPKDVKPLAPEWVGKYSPVFLHSKEFRDQLASFLWTRDLSDFDYGHCDRTLPARDKLIAASTTPTDEMADEIIASLPGCVVHSAGLRTLVAHKCANQKIVKDDVLLRVLSGKAILTSYNVSVDKKTYRCFVFKETDNYAAELAVNLKKLSGIGAGLV